ncbi:MAG: DUF1571 domain-containing protein [Planctomycetota bacterium]|nr:MAG: DUF1571 domain-containing protein [Planctomycetota bacterium]
MPDGESPGNQLVSKVNAMGHIRHRRSARVPNLGALAVVAGAVAILYVNFDPVVGDEGGAASERTTGLVSDMRVPPPPPLPEPRTDDSATDDAATTGGVAKDASRAETTQPAPGAREKDRQSAAGSPSDRAAQPSDDRDSQRLVLAGRAALEFQYLMLAEAARRLERLDAYTATFVKQERLGGTLTDRQVIAMRVRHRPFAVWMEWKKGGDRGRRVLFDESANSGKMLVRLGGVKGRFLPVMKLDPNGDLARSECRYPVTQAGLLQVTELAMQYRRQDLQTADGVRCRMYDGCRCGETACYGFVVDYDRPDVSEAARTFRRCELYLAKGTYYPVLIRNYGWGENNDPKAPFDESTLLEMYSFSELKPLERVAADAFAPKSLGGRLR